MREVALEFERDWENQAGLNLPLERAEEIGKCQARYGVRKGRHRPLHSVARKIYPFQKVRDLVSTNAEGDLKHFRICHFLTQSCVETRAALLDVSEVKARYIRDRLNMIVAQEIGVRSA